MNTWATNKEAFRFIWREQRWYFPVVMAQCLFNNLAPYLTLFFSGLIVNELAGAQNKNRLLTLVIITVALNAVIGVLNLLLNAAFNIQHKKLGLHEDAIFNDKVLHLDYTNLENPEIRDMRERIFSNRNINEYGIWFFVRIVRFLIGDIINLALAVIFSTAVLTIVLINPQQAVGLVWFPIGLILLIALYTFFSRVQNKKIMKAGHDLSEDMLQINKIGRGYHAYQMGKDVRLFRLLPIFKDNQQKAFDVNRRGFSIANWLEFRFNIPMSVVNQGIAGLIYAFVCLNALLGLFAVGYVLTFVGYISRLTSSVNSLFTELGNLKGNTPYLRLYLDFFAIKNTMYQGTLPVEKRSDNEYVIEFKNVSFRYPGSDNYALKNLNLKLTIGEKMAVVGMNGSGKTTMIKLLCRLYDPSDGVILLNGVDIKKYNYEEYMRLYSVVFQDFHLFSFALGQNEAASDALDREKAEQCLKEAGFADRLRELPKGLETPLYKNFDEDGIEISGGEAQKIALARALYKNAPIIVLDEPTAALDPIAEYDVYLRFNEIVGNKTTIYISHRLSSCRFYDDIAVFHEGQLIQRGSHDTLLADVKGKYSELWNAQAQYYNENAVS